MNYIEIKQASNGWIIYYTEYQSRGPAVKLFTDLKDAIEYLRELMSKK